MRLGRYVAVAAALALAVRALIWGGAGPLAAARAGAATFDELVALAATALASALLAWVALVLVATALAALPGALGGVSARFADRVAPGVAGRLARVALGLSLTAGPVSACTPALAGDSGLPAVGRIGEVIEPRPEVLAMTEAAPVNSEMTPSPAGSLGAEIPPIDGSTASDDPAPEPAVDPPATPEPAPTPTAGITAEPTREHHHLHEVVVKRGDTLWTIAARHLGAEATDAAIAEEWPRWYAANRTAIGDNPDLILPGMILRPPSDR